MNNYDIIWFHNNLYLNTKYSNNLTMTEDVRFNNKDFKLFLYYHSLNDYRSMLQPEYTVENKKDDLFN